MSAIHECIVTEVTIREQLSITTDRVNCCRILLFRQDIMLTANRRARTLHPSEQPVKSSGVVMPRCSKSSGRNPGI